MIELKTGGETWDLYPGTKIKFRFNHMAFNSTQTGSYSLPFRLPASPQNTKLIGFANLDHNTQQNTTVVTCDLYIASNYFFSGLLYVTEIDSSSNDLEVDLAIDTGPFARKLSNLTLKSSELNHNIYNLDSSGNC